MAQRVDQLPGGNKRGRPAVYPWEEWLDGHVWRLMQGEDFQGDAKGFKSTARSAAGRAGLQIITRTTDEPGALYIQAAPR